MRYAVNAKCQRNCTLNAINLPGETAEAVHQLYESGANREKIRLYLAEHAVRVSDGAIGRHKTNHLEALVESAPGGSTGKKTHLQILEEIIAKGGDTLSMQSVRISPEMTMKAIEMHHKLTEGSVWEDFLSAIGAMGDEVSEGGPENPDAQTSADEQAQGDSDVIGQ